MLAMSARLNRGSVGAGQWRFVGLLGLMTIVMCSACDDNSPSSEADLNENALVDISQSGSGDVATDVAMDAEGGLSDAAISPEVDQGPVPRPDPMGAMIYEIMDLTILKIWRSESIDTAAFEALALEPSWQLLPVRERLADQVVWRRSPDGVVDGVYGEQQIDGHMWRYVTQLETPSYATEEGLFTQSDVLIFQDMVWKAGRTVRILSNPLGEEFIQISRVVGGPAAQAVLPEGWAITERFLSEDLTLEFIGPYTRYTDEVKDGWQGPMADATPR